MQRDILNSIPCDKIFVDHGISGAKSKRPSLDKMLKYLEAGDTVIVYKLDRLGRSVQHLSDLLVLFDDNNIAFCSLTEGIDTRTSAGGSSIIYLAHSHNLAEKLLSKIPLKV